jgi:hypothetical protein
LLLILAAVLLAILLTIVLNISATILLPLQITTQQCVSPAWSTMSV